MIALAATTAVSQAAISVVNTTSTNNGSGAAAVTMSGFDLTGGTKLVVTSGTENAGGVGGIVNVTSVTFAGEALTFAIEANDTAQGVAIWYLDTPVATSGDIVITFSANAVAGVSAISMTGAATGILDQSAALGTSSGSLIGGTGAIVIGSFVSNSGAAIVPQATGTGTGLTTVFSSTINGGGGQNSASSYFFDDAATTQADFTGGDNRPVAVGITIAEVPEPSSAALIGLGGIALILRRRK